METNPDRNPPTTRPLLPTAQQIHQRYAELTNAQPQPPAPRPAPAKPTPLVARARHQLNPRALHGLAGHIVRTLAPHTEAPPVAILLQLLAAFGNALGSGPYCQVDATRHGLNLFVILVGDSSKSRKGTSWNQVAELFAEVDPGWLTTRVTNARLTAPVLTQILRSEAQPAGTDRRVLLLAEEFASVFHSMGGSRGQLSPLLRCAWDHGHLNALGKAGETSAGAHVSLIAHITERELAANLNATEAHNGFANRCLWAPVHRIQALPDGGSLPAHELEVLTTRLRHTLDWARSAGSFRLQRSEATSVLWHRYYADLTQSQKGIYPAATSRAEAQVLRLSALYAVLDSSITVEPVHLHAALALWDYCASGAAGLFGIATGDSIADRILAALNTQPNGISKTRISAIFHGKLSVERVDGALDHLHALGVIHASRLSGNGRDTVLWQACQMSERNLLDPDEDLATGPPPAQNVQPEEGA